MPYSSRRTRTASGCRWGSGTVPALAAWTRGVTEPHRHDQTYEIYLVARGHCVARIAGEPVRLGPGDMLVVEPGESHTFASNSEDYLHHVVQAPFVPGDKIQLRH